ncbi:ABC transporter permease [Metabacillus fastidiosus]|uniref:ABC transporter permease n=1 Tax=Metabacillus fastidiosus TaxID=1458 RepID=UPI002DBCB931|nr:ABC transporter permease [Metabacillus fastidiosus]MEC2078651.1 ABC transporter permease [Metabacillus fastidiosus]
MNSIDNIWSKRLQAHIQEMRTYSKYMLNDHLLFVLLFLTAGGAVAYQNWLNKMPENFPAIFIMTAAFTFLIQSSSVRTLLKEADLVFLLPLEKQMEHYFNKAFLYSAVTQMLPIIIFIIVFTPLYRKAEAVSGGAILLSLLLLAAVKVWNVKMSWIINFLPDENAKMYDFIVRLVVNILSIYFIFKNEYVFLTIVAVIMIAYYIYFTKAAGKRGIKWEVLIKKEEQKKQNFYQLANLFTDVPKLKKSAKRRKYLDPLLGFIKYNQKNTYLYMYVRAFLRSGDYVGIHLRLTIIGSVILVYLAGNIYSGLAISILFLFLTGIQLMSLYKHYDLLEISNLYPTADNYKLKHFTSLMRTVLIIQLLVFSIVIFLTAGGVLAAPILLISFAFTFLFVYVYMPKRLKKL